MSGVETAASGERGGTGGKGEPMDNEAVSSYDIH